MMQVSVRAAVEQISWQETGRFLLSMGLFFRWSRGKKARQAPCPQICGSAGV